MAKQNIAFNKMKRICDLEERHGEKLGDAYKNDVACRDSSQGKIKRGVVVLRSKHICGFYTFLRPYDNLSKKEVPLRRFG